jgi:hypothetical protein
MKQLARYFGAALVAGILIASQNSWAGECCKTAASKVKKGELCAKCMSKDAHECCKKSATAAAKEKDAKPCAKCSKKSEVKS